MKMTNAQKVYYEQALRKFYANNYNEIGNLLEPQEAGTYSVIFIDNGLDLFEGTYDECVKYIREVQVKEYGCKEEDFDIFKEEN